MRKDSQTGVGCGTRELRHQHEMRSRMSQQFRTRERESVSDDEEENFAAVEFFTLKCEKLLSGGLAAGEAKGKEASQPAKETYRSRTT